MDQVATSVAWLRYTRRNAPLEVATTRWLPRAFWLRMAGIADADDRPEFILAPDRAPADVAGDVTATRNSVP